MRRNNKNWTAEDEKLLLELWANGVHKSKIAEALHPTEAAIDARASAIRSRVELKLRG